LIRNELALIHSPSNLKSCPHHQDIKIIEEKERLIRAESSEDGGATSRISAGNSSKGEDSKPVKKKRGGMRGSIEFAATQVTLLTGMSLHNNI
jgi:hypothetical protein